MAVENSTTKSQSETPAELAWRTLQAAEQALNHGVDGEAHEALEAAYFAAQDAFIAVEDGTPRGALLKLKQIAVMEDLDGYLEENPRLAWPRIVKSIIRDLEGANVATSPPSVAQANRATEDDARTAILGLEGIFWALDMLVIHEVADEISAEDDRRDGIAGLIVAGEQLAREISERF
jgi:hypothetical protein